MISEDVQNVKTSGWKAPTKANDILLPKKTTT